LIKNSKTFEITKLKFTSLWSWQKSIPTSIFYNKYIIILHSKALTIIPILGTYMYSWVLSRYLLFTSIIPRWNKVCLVMSYTIYIYFYRISHLKYVPTIVILSWMTFIDYYHCANLMHLCKEIILTTR